MNRQELAPRTAPRNNRPSRRRTWRRCSLRTIGGTAESTVWAFEGKWDGYRLLVDAGPRRRFESALPQRTRRHPRKCPRLRSRRPQTWPSTVSCSTAKWWRSTSPGVPRFERDAEPRRATRRAEFLGLRPSLPRRPIPVTGANYSDPVVALLEALGWRRLVLIVPGVSCLVTGRRPRVRCREHRWEGVVAKQVGFDLPTGSAALAVNGSRTRCGSPRRWSSAAGVR